MAVEKYSRQRESIRKNLAGRRDHPTADMVYLDIRKEFPNISLGTVYRNLSLLAQLGEIQKISVSDGPDRFDGRTKPHDHFFCKECGCVLDFQLTDTDNRLQRQAGKGFEGRIDGQTVQFFGVCPDCLKKQTGNVHVSNENYIL